MNNTIVFTVASVACKFVVGMTIALLLNSRLPFRNLLTGMMLLPWIVPEVVTAMAWRSIYDPLSASGTWGPLLVNDDPEKLAPALRGYLLDLKPGYTDDPTRALYNHLWLIGDPSAISVAFQARSTISPKWRR